LSPVGADARPARQRRDDGACPAPAGLATKKKSLIATERDEAARTAWQAQAQTLDVQRLVFVDECSTTTSMTRRYGRAPGRARAVGQVPRNYGANLSLIASLRLAGIGPAMTLPGAVDAEAFVVYVREVLVPGLRSGDIVVMDNLSVHKDERVEPLLDGAGATLLFLPAYSPDYAPIEPAFSKIKAWLRAAARRTQEELEAGIGQALAVVTAQDARGWFKHCGYPLPGQP
jgi:transposase